MSTRQMARMYSSGGSGGGDGLLGLLQSIFGNGQITGGPEIGPDGKVIYKDYQGPKGFFNRRQRGAAQAANMDLKNALLLQQINDAAALLRQQESDKAATERIPLTKNVELLTTTGVPYTGENFTKFNAGPGQTAIDIAGVNAQRNKKQADIANALMSSPEGIDSFRLGQIGLNLEPIYRGQKVLNPADILSTPVPIPGQKTRGLTPITTTATTGGFPVKLPTGETITMGGKESQTTTYRDENPIQRNPNVKAMGNEIFQNQQQQQPVIPITTTNQAPVAPTIPTKPTIPSRQSKPFMQRSGLIPKTIKKTAESGYNLGELNRQTYGPLLRSIIQQLIGQ